MTLRELAESQELFVTNDEKTYFESRTTTENFMKYAIDSGIKVKMTEWVDRETTTYMVEEDKG